MANPTTYLRTALAGHVLMGTDWASPATVYLALFTTATTDAGGGTEVTGGGYARQPVTFITTGTPGALENSPAVDFATMPAVTVTNAAIYDDLVAGNMLLHAPLAAPRTTAAGDTLSFAVGDIDAAVI